MNAKTLIVRALTAPLAVVLSLGAVACDQPDSDTASFVFEVEELAEMALDAGNEELAASLLKDEAASLDGSLSLAVEENAPNASSKSLAECFVEYCFDNDPSLQYDGQCLAIHHPLGMEGVCIIAEQVDGCEAWQYYGEHCNLIPAL